MTSGWRAVVLHSIQTEKNKTKQNKTKHYVYLRWSFFTRVFLWNISFRETSDRQFSYALKEGLIIWVCDFSFGCSNKDANWDRPNLILLNKQGTKRVINKFPCVESFGPAFVRIEISRYRTWHTGAVFPEFWGETLALARQIDGGGQMENEFFCGCGAACNTRPALVVHRSSGKVDMYPTEANAFVTIHESACKLWKS